MERSREVVDRLVSEGRIAYGITTGFGRFKDKLISADQVAELQLNLIRSHAAGTGPELDEETVRAMLVIRANTLAMGYSGIRTEVVQLMVDMLNAGVHPCIPGRGSLGASGDLATLAHMSLVLIGEGEAVCGSRRLDGASALQEAGLRPVTLGAKEGLGPDERHHAHGRTRGPAGPPGDPSCPYGGHRRRHDPGGAGGHRPRLRRAGARHTAPPTADRLCGIPAGHTERQPAAAFRQSG